MRCVHVAETLEGLRAEATTVCGGDLNLSNYNSLRV